LPSGFGDHPIIQRAFHIHSENSAGSEPAFIFTGNKTMKHATLPRQYVSSPTPPREEEIYPFGTFCRRGNYCPNAVMIADRTNTKEKQGGCGKNRRLELAYKSN
jgi:hypothetical protein